MSVNSKMTAIADAIRAKTGDTSALTLDQMAIDIANIDTSENLDDVLAEQETLIDDIKAALATKIIRSVVTGTVTAANRAITVSGLSFTPNKAFLMAQSVNTSSGAVFCSLNTSALTQGHTNLREITLTFTADGFTAIPTETSKKYYGDYSWVAWAE